MLRGRLGLETARIPHADRHGLLWLSRGALAVRDGTLRFERQSGPDADSSLDAGEYGIPFQSLSMILLGPGSTVSHDALRLMARHGTALVAVGEDGVRCYTAPPLSRTPRTRPAVRCAPGATPICASPLPVKCTPCAWGKCRPSRTSTPCGAWKGPECAVATNF